MSPTVASVEDLTDRLAATGYLCDPALATVGFLALRMARPMLIEGEPGTGKTSYAQALAEGLDVPRIRLQCSLEKPCLITRSGPHTMCSVTWNDHVVPSEYVTVPFVVELSVA